MLAKGLSGIIEFDVSVDTIIRVTAQVNDDYDTAQVTLHNSKVRSNVDRFEHMLKLHGWEDLRVDGIHLEMDWLYTGRVMPVLCIRLTDFFPEEV